MSFPLFNDDVSKSHTLIVPSKLYVKALPYLGLGSSTLAITTCLTHLISEILDAFNKLRNINCTLFTTIYTLAKFHHI